MYSSTTFVDEAVSPDMDHLPCNVIDHDGPARCRVNVARCRMGWVHLVHGRHLRSGLNRLGNLRRCPAATAHLAFPFFGRMIAAKFPTWSAACVRHGAINPPDLIV